MQTESIGCGLLAALCLTGGALAAGPDVTLLDIQSTSNYGAVTVAGLGSVRGYAIGSHTCNMGSTNLIWANNGTPALAMNAYRLHNGRLMQIGLANCKTACCAAAGSGCGTSCNGQGGSVLGAGCLDVYGSGFNGGQTRLAPRSVINGYTGTIGAYPGTTGDAIFRRLQIKQTDLTAANFPGALYFVEGVYVATDDAAGGAWLNNATYKRVTVDASFNLNLTGAAYTQIPAIRAWRDHGLGANTADPSVNIGQVTIPGEGTFWWASKVRNLGNGRWMYDYAVFNLNSDRSGGSFVVPVAPGVTVSNIGSNQPFYHSGEPVNFSDTWTATRTANSVTFATPQTFQQNANSSALRWGTMYNFWFEADVPPTAGAAVTLNTFKPGASVVPAIPAGAPSVPPCNPDLDGDGNVDQDDVNYLINVVGGGANPAGINPDFNNDGNADQDDVSSLINRVAGGACP